MQSLEIISINAWQILISLCNLVLLFFILKRFLYKPVRKALQAREDALNERYAAADRAKAEAARDEALWSEKLAGADEEAAQTLKQAVETAQKRAQTIVEEGQAAAAQLLKNAEADAQLERKKAEADIKREIVDVSVALSEKLLERTVSAEDHRELIDRFLTEMGDGDAGEQ